MGLWGGGGGRWSLIAGTIVPCSRQRGENHLKLFLSNSPPTRTSTGGTGFALYQLNPPARQIIPTSRRGPGGGCLPSGDRFGDGGFPTADLAVGAYGKQRLVGGAVGLGQRATGGQAATRRRVVFAFGGQRGPIRGEPAGRQGLRVRVAGFIEHVGGGSLFHIGHAARTVCPRRLYSFDKMRRECHNRG